MNYKSYSKNENITFFQILYRLDAWRRDDAMFVVDLVDFED